MSTSDPIIGKKLGDYQIQSLLGRGGMARVYKGYDETLDRYAAVKVIATDFVASADEREYFDRFQREARAIAKLSHPYIVGLYQFGQIDNLYYMAMAFLDGRDLRLILKEHAERGERLSAKEVVTMARHMASALDYAHQQGVIHRDVKPSNIMMTRNGAVLTDFGLALTATEGTRGDTFGSAHYIAPEQAVSSSRAVPQSDLYSLGVILYEALSGRVPFDDPSAMSVALKHLNDMPPPPSLYNPSIKREVEEVLLKILHKDYKQRYQTGAELVEALAEVLLDDDTVELTKGKKGSVVISDNREKTAYDLEDVPAVKTLPLPPTSDKMTSVDSYLRAMQTRQPVTASTPPEGYIKRPDSVIIAPPQPPTSERLFQGEGDKERRSIPIVALIAVVVLLGAGIIAFLLLSDGDKNTENDETPNPALVGNTTDIPTAIVTAIPTELVTQVQTPEVVVPVVTIEPTEVPTERTTALPTELPTDIPTVSPTEMITETPTIAPTFTPTPSETIPTATTTPSLTPTPSDPPEIRLTYRDGAFILRNISSRDQDIGDLVFRGDVRGVFETTEWQEETVFRQQGGNIYAFTSGGCVFIVTREIEYVVPFGCRFINTYLIRASSSVQFWRATRDNTQFTVETADGDVLATCFITQPSTETDDEPVDTCEFAVP